MSQVLSNSGRPVGPPRRDLIHLDRQHGLMLYQHCVVGACPARHPDGRHLYVVAPDEHLPDGRVRTARPPVRSAHAADYARTVPGHQAVLARSPAPSGVLGRLFEATATGDLRAREDGAERYVAYSDHDTLRWTLTSQLVRDLNDCELVDDLDPRSEPSRHARRLRLGPPLTRREGRQPVMTTPLPERTLLPGPPYGNVRNALRELLVIERSAPGASTAVTPTPAQLTDLAGQWVKAAHTCAADMGSVTQRARWQTLITAVETRQDAHASAGTDVPALCTALRDLLLAMLEYSRLEPPVTGISDYLRSRIADGTCPPGSPLGVARFAAELRLAPVSAVRVKLALADLEAEGVVESTSNGIRVTGTPAGRMERSVQVAQWLRTLIRKGVYPPGSALPRVADLARPLVTPIPVISSAVALLDDEGTVRSGLGVRAVVVQEPGFAVAAPLDLTTVDRRLTLAGWAGSDTSPQRVRETCRRARSWWHHRIAPAPGRVSHTHRTLTSMAARLIPAAHAHHQPHQAQATMRRAAVTALTPQPEVPQEQLWRTACLAAAVLELQELAGDAA
ncbi:hypothetical protein ACH4TM_31215 [Streptomyces parvus]|uniref:hypothetical protein n=1 Tax=Streptomyces parvus TaxID=66428 RepID=UPI0037BE055E